MPRYNNPRRTWQYTNEFKVKAVQLSLIEGIQVKSVAETLDIQPSCCHGGVKSIVKER
jgi:transposase